MHVQYQTYFEDMPCYLSVHDRGYRIIDGNRRFRSDFGDRIGELCFRVYKDRDGVCPDCPVEKTFLDGCSHGSEQQLTTKDGSRTPVMVHTTPIRDSSGAIVAVMEMHTDICEVKRLQEELRRSQTRYAQLFEEVPCYITVQGPDLVIQHANRAFRETFGPAVGDQCFRVYKHRDERCLVCPARQTFADGKAREHEELLVTASGERLSVMCTTAPIRDSSGDVVAVLEMGTDITQIRQLQSQLTSIGLLVGSISHGIKGLLTGLDGGMYLVNSGFAKSDDERVRKGWRMVERNVDRIRSMVLDILYYAKDRDLDLADIDAARLAAEIGDVLEKKATDANVQLLIEASGDVGAFQADGKAVRAMLINILENSLDACRADGSKAAHHVRLAVRRAPPWVVFEIQDNGIGMDRETREKAFSLFFSSKGIQGTGLGLFISNKIVDKHGGSITVESEPGRGTRFLVRLPLEARPSVQPSAPRAGAQGGDHEVRAGSG